VDTAFATGIRANYSSEVLLASDQNAKSAKALGALADLDCGRDVSCPGEVSNA
jgi:hypothetical protein